MKILFTGSECLPFIKTGGLADVLGSLPKAINETNNQADVIIPLYNDIVDREQADVHYTGSLLINHQEKSFAIYKVVKDNTNYLFVDFQDYFTRHSGIYGHFDDCERFAFFNMAIVKYLEAEKYDVVHSNDWHTGMVPHLINLRRGEENFKDIKTVFTIHNIAYQGVFPINCYEMMHIPWSNDFEMAGKLNFLKTGIMTANEVTTVSSTYAEEILGSEYGYGLESVLAIRKDNLSGIVNGLDYEVFSPETDKDIEVNYSIDDVFEKKPLNKAALQKKFHLAEKADVPLIGVVSRLTDQKGFDLVENKLEHLLYHNDVQVIILGSGDAHLEGHFQYLRDKYPNKLAIYIGYHPSLAQQIYAGVDFFLMPSKYEPCGLAQIISMKYGTLPIVRETGGLKDTVTSYRYRGGSGFVFKDYNADSLYNTIELALKSYKNKERKERLIINAMKKDFSWNVSTKAYLKLYKR